MVNRLFRETQMKDDICEMELFNAIEDVLDSVQFSNTSCHYYLLPVQEYNNLSKRYLDYIMQGEYEL